MALEASLMVEEAATGREVFRKSLAPQAEAPVTVENLPEGTYRLHSKPKSEGWFGCVLGFRVDARFALACAPR